MACRRPGPPDPGPPPVPAAGVTRETKSRPAFALHKRTHHTTPPHRSYAHHHFQQQQQQAYRTIPSLPSRFQDMSLTTPRQSQAARGKLTGPAILTKHVHFAFLPPCYYMLCTLDTYFTVHTVPGKHVLQTAFPLDATLHCYSMPASTTSSL